MDKKAFVTGATGFLGINLTRELLRQGWEVTAIHRPSSDLQYLSDLPVTWQVGDIEDLNSLVKVVPDEVSAIFHTAASTNFWSKYNRQQYYTNVTGTENVIRAALIKNCHRLIHTSSIAAYGLHQTRIDENTESTAFRSGINYFKTKYLSEQAVKGAVAEGLNAVILNPAHIIGPYDRRNWVQLIKNVYHDTIPGVPDSRGCFGYVTEVAKAHINAFEHGRTGENYLLGGVEASMLEFVNQVQKYFNQPASQSTMNSGLLKLATIWYQLQSIFTGQEPLLTPEKTKLLTHNVLCDDTKAQNELGYQAVSLEKIVENTCKWLDKEGIL